MRLLLDTCVWLWFHSARHRIAPPVYERICDLDSEVYLSAASGWEIAIKHALGRLPLPESPLIFIPRELLRERMTALPVTMMHALEVAKLPPHHADPFDRLLIAQARVEGMTLVTADSRMKQYDVELCMI